MAELADALGSGSSGRKAVRVRLPPSAFFISMKKETVKLIKKASREKIPVSSLKGKVMPSKKRKLLEEALKKAGNNSVKNPKSPG